MNVNKVFFGGNLTKDPTDESTPSGMKVSDFSLASNYRFGDGEEKTTFVDVTAWGKQAESVVKHLKKGDSVLVEGRLEQDRWEDKETGGKRSKHKITADLVHFLKVKYFDDARAAKEE